jgi:hypothetical protein
LLFYAGAARMALAVDLKEFTFKLIILFFPGLLAFVLYDRLTVHKKVEPFYFVVNSLIFGILAYFLAWGFCFCCCPSINSNLVPRCL